MWGYIVLPFQASIQFSLPWGINRIILINHEKSFILFSESDSERFCQGFSLVFVIYVFFFTGPVLHYASWSPTSVQNLPRRIPIHFSWDGDTFTSILMSGGGFWVSADFRLLVFKALCLKVKQRSKSCFPLSGWPSHPSAFKIKRIGCSFFIRAICRIW